MNTRFAVAVHIVTFLACRRGEPATSDQVASSVGTHPALIRRIGAQLVRAGLLQARRGAGGGAVLGRDIAAITLLDVYRAIEDRNGSVMAVHRTADPCCSVGMHMQRVIEDTAAAVNRALEEELSRTTIADIVDAVEPARRTARARAARRRTVSA